MIEDKLDRIERLRLECLNQAVQHHNGTIEVVRSDDVVETARKFENYVKSGRVASGPQ